MKDYADTERQLREWAVIARGQGDRTTLEGSPNFSAEARADIKAGFYAQEKLLTEAAAAIADLTRKLEEAKSVHSHTHAVLASTLEYRPAHECALPSPHRDHDLITLEAMMACVDQHCPSKAADE